MYNFSAKWLIFFLSACPDTEENHALKTTCLSIYHCHPGILTQYHTVFPQQHLTFKLNSKTVSVLSSLDPSFLFSFFTFPSAPYQIFILFLHWLPCHFYFIVIEQKQQQDSTSAILIPHVCEWVILLRVQWPAGTCVVRPSYSLKADPVSIIWQKQTLAGTGSRATCAYRTIYEMPNLMRSLFAFGLYIYI